MEVGTAAAAMSTALANLALVLDDQVRLDKGTRTKLMSFTQELLWIQGFVSKAEHPAKATEFLKKAMDLCYDIDDYISEVMLVKVRSRVPKRGNNFVQRAVAMVVANPLSNRYRKLISEAMALSEEACDWCKVTRGTPCRSSFLARDPRPPALVVAASRIVGMHGPGDELAQLLLMETECAEQLRVVSIVGSGGLGKTTLAKEIYRRIHPYFDCVAWVSMPPHCTLRHTLWGILLQVEESHNSGDDSKRDIIGSIRECLQHRRYLLVIDGMWNPDAWTIIRLALPFNDLGSRVITTTRSFRIAQSCCSDGNSFIYDIKPLSLGDSRALFHGRIFGSIDGCPPCFIDIADKILMKCAGFPLVIAIISGLLAYKNHHRRSVWKDVCDSIDASPRSMEGMRRILYLSYLDLPFHLKACFLYLCAFPVYYLINHDRIVRSWIAEGFIFANDGRTLEEVAEGYLYELSNRNMIQPVHGRYDDKPEAYLVHHLVIDLITYLSRQGNFFTTLHYRTMTPSAPPRRLSIIDVEEDLNNTHPVIRGRFYSSWHFPSVRSLYIFDSVGPKFKFKDLSFLRVLDLEGCKDLENHHVKEIAGLIHLSFLSFRDTPISQLPDRIDKLLSLTTLDLRGTSVRVLPMSVFQLKMLARLLCDKMGFMKGLGNLLALSCLSQFDIFQSELFAVDELGNLSELRELVLWWFPGTESDIHGVCEHLAFSLGKLEKLHSLYIHGSDSSVHLLEYLSQSVPQLHRIQLNRSCYLQRIPEWFRSLPSLTYICIDVLEVTNEELQLFSELPSLLYLSLSSMNIPRVRLAISSEGFPVLREFHLHSARPDLVFEPHAMQKVENLLLSLYTLQLAPYCSINMNIDQLMCLKKIDIRINGKGEDALHLFKCVDIAIRKAAEKHPNYPIVNITALGKIDHAAKEGNESVPSTFQREIDSLVVLGC